MDTHEALTFHALDGIGDVNSDARGSGARYNAGKIPMGLIPLRIIAANYLSQPGADPHLAMALDSLGLWQEGGDGRWLHRALSELGDGWAECAQVFEYGKGKYAPWNWAKGMSWSVPMACAARHIVFGLMRDESDDPESKLPHRGHVYCNIVMMLTFMRTYPEGDDRPKELSA